MSRRIYLIRHGMTAMNEEHRYCGWTDVPLSEKGKELLQKLKSCIYPPAKGCRIVTSGMLRTQETLRLLYGNVAHESCVALREMHFGAFEGKSYEELKSLETYCRWISGDNEENVCPQGESGEQMSRRVLEGLQVLLESCTEDLMLFTHGGPIAAVMRTYFPEEQRNRYEWQSDFGCGYEITLSDDEVSYRIIPSVREE